jgi:hypothetical protein
MSSPVYTLDFGDCKITGTYMGGTKQSKVIQKLIVWGFLGFVKEFMTVQRTALKERTTWERDNASIPEDAKEKALEEYMQTKVGSLFLESNLFETLEQVVVKLESRNSSLEELLLLMLDGCFVDYEKDGKMVNEKIDSRSMNKVFSDLGILTAVSLAWGVFQENGFLSQFTTLIRNRA